MEAATAPNPEGFFAELTDSDACSVAVAVRVRPLIGRELTEGNRQKFLNKPSEPNDKTIELGAKKFTFDKVFWDDVSQEYIFDTCTRNLVLGCFHGFNATIFAYGQTGSGKTHSMGTGSSLGVPFSEIGIVPRVFKFIFDELALRRAQSEFSEFKIKVQFLEIYNEELHDLLDPNSMVRDKITGKPMKELKIKEQKNGVITIHGLKENEVNNQDECLFQLNNGINHRITSATGMNAQSSRSHAIFTISIDQKIVKTIEVDEEEEKKDDDGENKTVTEEISSKFHFVDLAGSERIKKTGAQGQQMKEGISINKGLLCLGQVIKALTDKGLDHIPYRDSKLTRILQDSLGGNSRTTMLACVSPAEYNYEETLSTIRYASNARNIKNKPIVNRDANSMLIESLRTQIQSLQLEVKEYTVLLQENNVPLPNNFNEKVLERQKTQQEAQQRRQTLTQPSAGGGGGANPAEVKELKIKLSHKEREYRDLVQKLKDNEVYMAQKDQALAEAEKERDAAVMKAQALEKQLKENNIEPDLKAVEAQAKQQEQKGSLADQYKGRNQKMTKDLEAKQKEIQEKEYKLKKMQEEMDRNTRMLKKHMDENNSLKKQLQNFSGGSSKQVVQKAEPVVKKDFKALREQRKEKTDKIIEEFNEKIFSNLSTQFDEMLSKAADKKADLSNTQDTTAQESTQNEEESKTEWPEQSEEIKEVDEKSKILDDVRKMHVTMQTELQGLLKGELAGMINDLEGQKNKANTERKEKLSSSKNDEKAQAQIEKDFKVKMEKLDNEKKKLEREKQKKEESVAKQIASQETRIKALEAELVKMRKKKEEVEQAKKTDEGRFFKFKQTVSKDITDQKKQVQDEKKRVQDKEKQISKIKQDHKKVEALAQSAISQLKGMQKRAIEDKKNREAIKEKEAAAQGLDFDVIKEWITMNTEAQLKHRELREYRDKQEEQKDKIETEMLEDGDRLTDVLVQKEKLEFEKEDLENAEEKDEGRLLEIEDQINDLVLEINSISQSLEDQSEALEFVQSKLNQAIEEIEGFDLDSCVPMSFNALESIESAKATLRIFFEVVLDLNVYKRDLEQKCIEQDEQVINYESQVKTMEERLKFAVSNGGTDGYADQVQKQNALVNMVNKVGDDFVDQSDLATMNLSEAEKQSFTKLNLSKIVNNLRKKLSEQEAKTQRISLKLDQALKQKEIYKQRADEAKKELKDKTQFKKPTPFQAQANRQDKEEVKSPFKQEPPKRTLSFKERRAAKTQVKTVESLADRRNKKKAVISEDLDSELDKLKQNAEALNVLQKGLEVVAEDEGDYGEEDIEDEGIAANQKLEIKNNVVKGSSVLEPSRGNMMGVDNGENVKISTDDVQPDGNFPHSQYVAPDDIDNYHEQWIQKLLIQIELEAPLVDYYLLSSRIICIFEDGGVKEIGIQSGELEKDYNLAEIDGFEKPEGKVIAFCLEKDVQLAAVSFESSVFVFEYDEENTEGIGLSQITKFDEASVMRLIFAEYYLIMVQNQDGKFIFKCSDLDSTFETAEPLEGTFIQIKNGNTGSGPCIYYSVDTNIGKLEVPSMKSLYHSDTGHNEPVDCLTVSQDLNMMVTTSKDESIRFFNTLTGKECDEPIEEIGADCVSALGQNLLTRLGQGADRSLILWRMKQQGGIEEDPIDEIELEEAERKLHDESQKFVVKSGVLVSNEDRDKEQHVFMFEKPDQISFSLLAQKMIKF